MYRYLAILSLAASAATAVANETPDPSSGARPAKQDSQAWLMYGRDLHNTNHYPHAIGADFEQKWAIRIGCPAPGMSSTLVGPNGTYNTSPCSNTGDTHAVGLDGKKLWSHGVGQGKRGIISTPCVHDGTLYVVDNGLIKALKADDGTLLWKQEINCGRVSISSPVVYEGKLYLSGPDGVQILQLDRKKSAEDAFIDCKGGHNASTPAFHDGDIIFLGLQHVYSYDTKTLEQNWNVDLSARTQGRLVNAPVVDAQGGNLFVVSSEPYEPSGRLHCLKLADGKPLWEQDLEGVNITPCITFDGEQLYVASMNGTIRAFNANDGKQVWQWVLPGEPKEDGKLDHSRILKGLVSTKNKLVFLSSNKLFIISNDKPDKIDFEVELHGFSSPTPAFYEGDLYFRSRTKELGATNYCYAEPKQEQSSDLEVSLSEGKVRIRNRSAFNLIFFQFCYGINVNEKQNCVPYDLELEPGGETVLELGRFMTLDDKVKHLLLSLEYEKSGKVGAYANYFELKHPDDKPTTN